MSIKSISKRVGGARHSLVQNATVETVSAHLATETPGAPASLPTIVQQERVQQMYQLANIFASIFEALPDMHAHAIATTREAA